jgi:hypothetical protein
LKAAAHSLGRSPFEPTLTQYFHSPFSFDQLSSFRLREACSDAGGNPCALLDQPIVSVYLFANDLKRLIEDLTWIMKCADFLWSDY